MKFLNLQKRFGECEAIRRYQEQTKNRARFMSGMKSYVIETFDKIYSTSSCRCDKN